jgi:hypothetical protein
MGASTSTSTQACEINLTAFTQTNVMTIFVRPLQRRNVRVLHDAALSVLCSVRVLIAKGLLTRRRSTRIVEALVKLLSVAPWVGKGGFN